MTDNICKPEISRILSIVGFIIILLCIFIIAENPGVSGYEISLYDEYSWYLWYLIIIAVFTFDIVLFLDIYQNAGSYHSWKYAYIGIVISNSILILIPLIRRYAVYGSGDPCTHMGYMLDILHTGYVGNNMYPIDHILAVIIHYICGFNLNISMLSFPFIFYLFYALSFFVLFKKIFSFKNSILIGMILAPILFAGHGNISFTPQAQSNYYLPFIIYLYFSRFGGKNVVHYGLLSVVVSIFITFFHPILSLILIAIFCIFELARNIFKYLKLNNDLKYRPSFYLILIMIIIFFLWQSYAYILIGSIARVISWLYDESTASSKFEAYSQSISDLRPDIIFLLKSFIYAYGIYILFILMGVISVFVLLRAWKGKDLYPNIYTLMFFIGFIFCGTLYILSPFIAFTGFSRIGHYAILFSILLVPIAFGHLSRRRKNQKYVLSFSILFLAVLLFSITYLSVFTLYLSPITKSSGQHVADSQLVGLNSFIEIRAENIEITEGGLNIYRMKHALYGKTAPLINVVISMAQSIPPHFNYTKATYLGDYYGNSTYMIISTPFRIFWPKVIPEYPEKWNFNQNDFYKLENDESVSRVYSNRELDVYLLNPILRKESLNEEDINN